MGQDKNTCGKTLAVIGEGIASLIFLKDLADFKQKNLTLPFDKILWISSPELSPGCSLWSTALVAKHGIKKGLSPLGDELSSAYDLAAQHYENYPNSSVQKIDLTYFEDEKGSVARRFSQEALQEVSFQNFKGRGVVEAAYLIHPEAYLKEIRESILKVLPEISCHHDLVTDFKREVNLLIAKKENYTCHAVFWGVSAGRFLKEKFHGKTITGHVLRFDDVDFGEKSFALNLFGKNLIYRHIEKQKVLFVGATTANDGELFPDAQELQQQWSKLFHLPEFDQLKNLTPKLWGGPRHKLSKRRPRIEALNEQEFCAVGFYKSGYSLAHLAAREARLWWAPSS